MLKLSVYLFHHTSFFAVCSTNSVTLGRKSVARKKKIDSGKTRLLCNAQNNSFVRAEWAKGSQGGGGDQVCRGGCGGKSDGSVFARTTGFCKT